jgi:CheY-like chemotaxis protein
MQSPFMSDPRPDDAPRLLLCDDSPIERLALAHYLRSSGYLVDEAGDGKSALQFLKHRKIDLLLLDLQMPDVDGFDVLNYVNEHRRALPVILMSGMPLDEIQREIHTLRQRELPPLMLKPVDPEQVLDMVELQLAGGDYTVEDDDSTAPGSQRSL